MVGYRDFCAFTYCGQHLALGFFIYFFGLYRNGMIKGCNNISYLEFSIL